MTLPLVYLLALLGLSAWVLLLIAVMHWGEWRHIPRAFGDFALAFVLPALLFGGVGLLFGMA